MRTLRRVERGTRPLLLELRRAFRDRRRAERRVETARRTVGSVPSRDGRRRRPVALRSRRVERRLLSSLGVDFRDGRSNRRFSFRTVLLILQAFRLRDLAFVVAVARPFFLPSAAVRTRRGSIVRGDFYVADALVGKRAAERPLAESRPFFPLAAPLRSRRRRLFDFVERSASSRRRDRSPPSRRVGPQLDFPRTPLRRA